ncbi:MAG: ArnT family glycosyltransferase, partial [Chthoniobacterales bacterium]
MPVAGNSAGRISVGFMALALLGAVMFFPGLGSMPLLDDDETRFASVAREMVRSGDWIVPRFNGDLADKPPLSFWIMAGSFRLFGVNAFAARFGSAFVSMIALLVLYRMAARLYDQRTAFWSGLVLLGSLLFVAEARLATTDACLLALVMSMLALAVGGWWSDQGALKEINGAFPRFSAWRAMAIGLFGGLGILCKGPAALVLPFLTLWLFAWRAHFSFFVGGKAQRILGSAWLSLRGLRPILIFSAAFLVSVPWHFALWQADGLEWFRLFYGLHYLGRLPWVGALTGFGMSAPAGHGGFPFFQAIAMLAGLFPWSVFLPLAVWRTFRGAKDFASKRGAGDFLVTLWLMVWLMAVSFSSTQLPHYAFPAYPSACIMIASLVVDCRRSTAVRDVWLYAAAGGLAWGGVIIGAAMLFGGRWLEFPVFSDFAWLGLIPLVCAALFAFAVRSGARVLGLQTVALGALALQWAAFQVALPRFGELDPTASILV